MSVESESSDSSIDVEYELHPDAVPIDFARERDEQSTSWERAHEHDGVIDVGDRRGYFTVALEDGDSAHDVFCAEAAGEMVGWCDCDGFTFHGEPENTRLDGEKSAYSPCAHLCHLRQEAVLNQGLIPEIDVAEDDLPGTNPGNDSDDPPNSGAAIVVDEDDQDGADRADHTEPATPDRRDVQDVTDKDEFVEEIAGVPPVFVVDMGRGKESKPYVTKEGLNYIGQRAGIETRAEEISPSWEDDADVAAYRGIAIDADGRRYEDVATAHASEVEDTVGRENMDELASTRATNRALRLATGCGFATIEEIDATALEGDDVQEGPA